MSTANPNRIQIRKGRKGDRAAILSFTRNTFHWGDYLDQTWDDWLKGSDGRLLVASIDGKAVGTMHVAFLGEREAWFEGMRVHPAYRRRGIARLFIARGIALGKQKSCRVVRLETASNNIPAQKALRGFGFRRKLSIREFTSHSMRGPTENIRLALTTDAKELAALWDHSWYNRAARSMTPLDDPWHWGNFAKSRLEAAIAKGRVWVTPAKGQVRGFAYAREQDEGLEVSLLSGQVRDLLNGLRSFAEQVGKEKCFLVLPKSLRLERQARDVSFHSEGDEMLIYERDL